MKIVKGNINFIFVIMLFVFSCINICIYLNDFIFVPVNDILFMLIFISVSIAHMAAALKYKSVQTNISLICAWFIPFFVLIFSGTLMFSLTLSKHFIVYFEIFLILALVSAFVIFFNNIRTKKIRILMAVLNSVWLLPLLVIIIFSIILFAVFNDFGEQKITQELYSQDRTYYVWVLSDDQGALGGDTYVYVRNVKRDKNILIGTLKSKDIFIKSGEFGQVYFLQWEDNETLYVDGLKYCMSNKW